MHLRLWIFQRGGKILFLLFKKGGISWRDENLHPFEMKWIVDEVKNLKSNRKEIVL